jgi:hypothetical protein
VPFKVIARPEAQQEIRGLGSNALKLEVAMLLIRLENDPYLGRPLGNLPGVGDLSDCMKIFVDERRYRIIYRLLPESENPTHADVIIVGKRAQLEVYIEAVKRLGRDAA